MIIKKDESKRTSILDAAMAEAERVGVTKMTRDAVAESAGVACGLVSYYFGDMDGLRDAVMQSAVDTRHMRLIVQGIAMQHPVVMAADRELKSEAINNSI